MLAGTTSGQNVAIGDPQATPLRRGPRCRQSTPSMYNLIVSLLAGLLLASCLIFLGQPSTTGTVAECPSFISVSHYLE